MDKRYRIIKHGNKTPRPNLFRQTYLQNTPAESRENLRQSEAYIQLPVVIKSSFFQDTLVVFIILCYMAINLVEGAAFVEFLTVLYPSLGQSKLLPGKDRIYTWIMDIFKVRQNRMKAML